MDGLYLFGHAVPHGAIDGALVGVRKVATPSTPVCEALTCNQALRQQEHGGCEQDQIHAYGRWRILPILQTYMRRWPEVGVEVRFSDRIDDLVEEGLDLAVRAGGTGVSDGLVARVVDRMHGVLCASPDYLAQRGTPDGAEMLDGHELLLFGQHGWIRPWPWPVPAQSRSSRARARTVLDSAEALRSAALAGLGIAHLPDFLVASDLEHGRLVSLSREPSDTVDIYALYPDRRLLPTRVRLFIDMIVKQRR